MLPVSITQAESNQKLHCESKLLVYTYKEFLGGFFVSQLVSMPGPQFLIWSSAHRRQERASLL